MTSDNTMPRNKTFTTRKMVTVAMLSAIATVIYYLDFPVPLMPGFIKLDLSNVIKNVIQLIIKGLGTTMGIGNIFDFVTSAAFVLTASVIYHKKKTRKNAIISCIIGTLVFTVISLPLNYFIVYPIYFKAFGGEAAILGMYQQIMGSVKNIFSALCIFNLPFTFVKGIICALVTILIYKPLSPILKGKD